MIQLNGLQKTYGELAALDVESLQINAGESFGLVGNNGAGKTTMFSLILDLIRPSQGEAIVDGKVVSNSEDWKSFTGSYLDENFLIDYLTPEEYFEFVGKLYGWNKDDVYGFLNQFEEFFNGEILGNKRYIRDLSKGNQKKLGIIASFIGAPKLVLLDEPFANLDPTSQIRLKNIIRELDDSMTILISSHDLNHITEVCDRIVVLENGRVVKDIPTNANTLKELETYFAV